MLEVVDCLMSIQEDAEEILRQRQLGYSFVRLLPKETGVRPIINLRRRENKVCGGDRRYISCFTLSCVSQAGPYKQSINQILKAAFHILTYEKVNIYTSGGPKAHFDVL